MGSVLEPCHRASGSGAGVARCPGHGSSLRVATSAALSPMDCGATASQQEDRALRGTPARPKL